jgi:hypothetical protein
VLLNLTKRENPITAPRKSKIQSYNDGFLPGMRYWWSSSKVGKRSIERRVTEMKRVEWCVRDLHKTARVKPQKR